MFKKVVFLLVSALLLTPFITSVAFAASGSNCPTGFTLEMVMHHHDHEHEHLHVGTSADKNSDGYICMKPITPDGSIHVHTDNNVP